MFRQWSWSPLPPDPRGQIPIESKEESHKRSVKSPDRAEATMLAFANRTPGIIEYYRDLSRRMESGAAPANEQDDDDLTKVYEEGSQEVLPLVIITGMQGARKTSPRWARTAPSFRRRGEGPYSARATPRDSGILRSQPMVIRAMPQIQ